jgi:hypothetical protein
MHIIQLQLLSRKVFCHRTDFSLFKPRLLPRRNHSRLVPLQISSWLTDVRGRTLWNTEHSSCSYPSTNSIIPSCHSIIRNPCLQHRILIQQMSSLTLPTTTASKHDITNFTTRPDPKNKCSKGNWGYKSHLPFCSTSSLIVGVPSVVDTFIVASCHSIPSHHLTRKVMTVLRSL